MTTAHTNTQAAPTDDLRREMWFAARIAERTSNRFECLIFCGVTDRAVRAQRAREILLAHNLTDELVFATKPDTFGSLYERLYADTPPSAEIAA